MAHTPIPNKLAATLPTPDAQLFMRNEEDLIAAIRKTKADLSRAEKRLTDLYRDYPALAARYASGVYYNQYAGASDGAAGSRALGEG
jgi:hypothetical protein